MNIWQKMRLYIETHSPVWFILIFVVYEFGLFDVIVGYDIIWPGWLMVAGAVFMAVALLVITRKTDHWWYEEYEDNKWGESRKTFTEWDESIKDLHQNEKE